jgi:organic radical activating enzyme
MQKIPDTFCPDKWESLSVNFNYNLAYGCCKATPIKFYKNFEEVMQPQKQNLLLGIKDTSCDYCWLSEQNNGHSRRSDQLQKFDSTRFQDFLEDKVKLSELEISIGNSCNLQCLYCNPKFSSEWEKDITQQPYKLFTDRYNYQIEPKNKNVGINNLELIKTVAHKKLKIVGGEPLYFNKFFDILEQSSAEELSFPTNLMSDQLPKLAASIKKFQKVSITVSIDATKDLAEFLRHGLNWERFWNNVDFIYNNTSAEIHFHSVITNLSIFTLKDFYCLLVDRIQTDPTRYYADMSYCVTPSIQSFETLSKSNREFLLAELTNVESCANIRNFQTVVSALRNTKYSVSKHKEFLSFLEQWEQRRNTTLPYEIKKCLS